MKRTTLTPDQAAWLDATFRRNANLYGGLRMMADDDGDGDDADKGGDGKEPDKGAGSGAGDEPLGDAGKRALEAERNERKALKAELDTLKTGLAAALGTKADAGSDDDKTLLDQIQQQIHGMQREAAVLTIANTHKITDEADLALLRSATDEDAMKRLAERLAPGDESTDDKPKPARRPKPDLTQGGGAGEGGADSGVGAGRDLFKASRKTK